MYPLVSCLSRGRHHAGREHTSVEMMGFVAVTNEWISWYPVGDTSCNDPDVRLWPLIPTLLMSRPFDR